MDAIDVDGTRITVALVGGRRFRERCLAHFLEMNGLRIKIAAVEHLSEGVVGHGEDIDLVVIDTGDHSCSDPGIRTILANLSDVLPGVPAVVVSDREDWSAVFDALQQGVRAYFPSSLDPEILVETLRFVQKGGTFIPLNALINAPVHRNGRQGAEGRPMEMCGLTPGEQRVLELLKKGQPNKAIARELDIEETTVKVHVRRIMRKLHASNRTQAALAAQQMTDAVA
jgi:DNA-binding NarL/FixJ family response regulator